MGHATDCRRPHTLRICTWAWHPRVLVATHLASEYAMDYAERAVPSLCYTGIALGHAPRQMSHVIVPLAQQSRQVGSDLICMLAIT